MKVFISWSGKQSRELANALCKWLPNVLPPIDPWMSDSHIPKGEVWVRALSAALNKHEVGILCVTHENCQAPWLCFEAGALFKAYDESRIHPLLFGPSLEELSDPLKLFQPTQFDRNDLLRLLLSLNGRTGKDLIDKSRLEEQFNQLAIQFRQMP